MSIEIATLDGSVELEYTLNGLIVDYLFDENGEETFDPSCAIEAVVNGESVLIKNGDKLTVEFIYGYEEEDE